MTRSSVRVLFVVLFALPWLNPFATGPSTWVGPWLVSAICAAAAFGLGRAATPRAGVGLVFGGLAAWGLLRSGWSPETLALAAGCVLVWLMTALAAAHARDAAFVRLVAGAWALAAVASTAAALLQYFGVADRLEPWVDVSAAGEAFANLRQRNQFASLTAVGMAASLWLAPTQGRRWPWLVAMAWLATGNAATTSRTGLIELVLLGAVTWRWAGMRSGRMRLWLVGLATYAAAAIVLPLLADAAGVAQNPVWQRVTDGNACGSRLVLWSNVLHLIAQRPWLGWGWGDLDYAHYMTLYPGARFCDILDNAHNLPLHVAVELGLPAALALCGFIAWCCWRGQPWDERDEVRQLPWTVVMVLAVHSMLEYPLWYGPFQIALGLALGLLHSPGGTRATTTWARAGLLPRQPDLPAGRGALPRVAPRPARAPGRLLALSQPGAVRRADAHATDAGQCGLDIPARAVDAALLAGAARHREGDRERHAARPRGRRTAASRALSRRVSGGL
jgi:O-antigen ligase